MTNDPSFLKRPAIRATLVLIALVGFAAVVRFKAAQLAAPNYPALIGETVGETIIVVLVVYFLMRQRLGEFCAAMAILFVGFGAYEAYQATSVRQRIDGYKMALGIIASKAQVNMRITDADLDTLHLGDDERTLVKAMADYANVNVTTIGAATAAWVALPFKQIVNAAHETVQQREAYAALVTKAQAANDAVVPGMNAAFGRYQSVLKSSNAPEAAEISRGSEMKEKTTLAGFDNLTRARRMVLLDLAKWLAFLQTPGLAMQVNADHVVFAKQSDVDTFQQLTAQIIADAAAADAALNEMQKERVQDQKELEDVQKM